jgi:ribosomal protein S18 acetylase RimI-like enzyme
VVVQRLGRLLAWALVEAAKDVLDIRKAELPADAQRVRSLLEEYVRELGVDLGFQGLAEELSDAAAAYPPPGGLWLPWRAGRPVGAVALRPLGGGYAELKRLFVLKAARGAGLGRALVETALGAARAQGFCGVRLDTLHGMDAAQALYASLGFVPIRPYRQNPLPGAQFLELGLFRPRPR